MRRSLIARVYTSEKRRNDHHNSCADRQDQAQNTRARAGSGGGRSLECGMGECNGRTIAREVDNVGQQVLIGADRGTEGRHQDIFVLCGGICVPSHSWGVFKLF